MSTLAEWVWQLPWKAGKLKPWKPRKQSSPEDIEVDLSVPEGIGIDDPVRMYLKKLSALLLAEKKK